MIFADACLRPSATGSVPTVFVGDRGVGDETGCERVRRLGSGVIYASSFLGGPRSGTEYV